MGGAGVANFFVCDSCVLLSFASLTRRPWQCLSLGLLTFCYYCLCTHSSPLGKEVKQERNLSGRKQQQKNNNEKEKKEEIRRIKKGGKRERKAADR